MPPKGKKKGKGKGKGKKKKDEGPAKPLTPAEATEKELLLQSELNDVTDELERAKRRVDELKEENEWLQKEAQKVRVESHEYMSYMEKKTSKRQTTIISLSDFNKQEIRKIEIQQQLMEEEYGEKKKVLDAILLEKQHLLEKSNNEISELQEYRDLQTEQLNKIQELEQEVVAMRQKHTDKIQELKCNFLKEKQQFKQTADSRIQSLEKQAQQEAFQTLSDYANRIKTDNSQLRQELLALIQQTRALHAHRQELEEQKTQLLREQQYAEDLKKLRHARQNKILTRVGFKDNSGSENEERVITATPDSTAT